MKNGKKDCKIYDVAVIGGGAAGLICLLELLNGENGLNPENVVLLEKNDRVGKKLLATGNGQCNLSNQNISEKFYHGDPRLIDGFIKNFNSIGLIDYLKSFGIYTESDETGRIYPVSKQASAVLDQIRAYITCASPVIKTGFTAKDINFNEGIFTVSSEAETVFAESVVFACGGKAGADFGTDGSAYSLLKKFGHNTGDLYPSIVRIKTEREKIKGLKNLKEKAKVTLMKNGNILCSFTGDLLFTDYGVSGNAVFSASAYMGGVKNPTLNIEFLPEYTETELKDILIKRKGMPFIKDCGEFVGLINKRIGTAIEKTANTVNAEDLSYAAKHFTLKTEGTAGFDSAQTTKGGFSQGIDVNTYESLKRRNLYIIGEALDVDGDCGGYNLTFAFVSAITAAKRIKFKKEYNYSK